MPPTRRFVSVVLLPVVVACTPSPSLDACRHEDCWSSCAAAGRGSGSCSAEGFCVCSGSADAADPDAADPLDAADADVPDEPSDVAGPEDSGEGDGAPTDVGWTPSGSRRPCSGMMPDACGVGEICVDEDFCPSWGDGICLERPLSCPPWDHPVCGCSGLTYGNECLRLAAGDTPRHDGRCVPGEDQPYCSEFGRPGMTTVSWYVNPMGTPFSLCDVDCLDCTAECRNDGLPNEGWYAVCVPPPPYGSGGCADEGLIRLADCL